MKLIQDPTQLKQNIEKIENYLSNGTDQQKTETIKLIKRGTCFIAYTTGKELRFAPSRFLGYVNNTISKHTTMKVEMVEWPTQQYQPFWKLSPAKIAD